MLLQMKPMKSSKHLYFILFLLFVWTTSHASSVIPPRDFGVLVQTSGLVVVAKAGDSHSFGRGNLIMTSTRFQVVDVIKGSIAIGQSFNMESYGGQTEDFGMVIGGSPSFVEGETYLLSLSEHNGAWMSRHMSYGLMVQRRMLTGERIFTHLEESHDLNLVIPDGKTVELISNYKAESLVEHLKLVASGKTIWNKAQADEVQEYDAHQSQSMLLPGNIMKLAAPPTGCDYMTYQGTKIRWKRFEDSQPVNVKVPSSATSQVINAAQTAVNLWKDVPNINVSSLQSNGASAISPTCGAEGLTFAGFQLGDARIFPDDPCNEVTDLSGCSGILAVAGPGFIPTDTHTANGETWITAQIGFMIVNNGTPGCLNATQYDQVITHELGHIIGFGHHTGGAANMNANCCNPITEIDRTCAVYIYGNGQVTTNPIPTITSIVPNSIKAGTSDQPVVITGTGFLPISSPILSPAELGMGQSVQSFNSTTLNMTFSADPNVVLGVRKFYVRNPAPGGGDSQLVDFIITDTPTISSISPSSGNAGSTVNLTINGTKFATGLTSLVVDSDLAVSNFTVVDPTQITASLSIPSNATTSTRTIRVSNLGTGGGNSNALSFNIIGATPAPTLTSVSPNSGAKGQNVNITVTGSNFIPGDTQVQISGSGIDIANVSVNSTSSITATLVIASSASTGTRSITVLTSGGTSGGQVFTVNEPSNPVPVLSNLNPSSALQGTSPNITITGTGFISGSQLSISGSGVQLSNISINSSTNITASLTIASGATGVRQITVTNPVPGGGTSNALNFTITELFINKAPTLNTISDINFLHSSPEQVIPLTGISAGSGENQNISIQATTANPSLIPILTVDYLSPQATGTLRLRNDRTKVGSTTVRVRVKDDGGTANGGVDSLVREFNVTVILDTSIGDDESDLPQEYQLLQNYPNPFNPTTIIPFTLPNRSRVKLSVFDVNGRERVKIIDQEMSAGRHDISFDASLLSSGLYLIRLSSDLGIQTKMMMLVK
jgi:hypothetical protein